MTEMAISGYFLHLYWYDFGVDLWDK